MIFPITIDYHRKSIRLTVEQLFIDDRIERCKVTARNGSITMESNRPLFRARGLKHRMPNWKQVEGQTLSSHALELIAQAIQYYIERESQ